MKKILHACVRFRRPSESDNEGSGQEHMNGTADELVAFFEVNGDSNDWPTQREAFRRKRFDFKNSLTVYLYYFQDLAEDDLQKAYASKLGHFQWELVQMNGESLPDLYFEIEDYFAEIGLRKK
ncbi:MAG: hypothetical protein K8I82_18655 [Anaerolineae bacterium]|nr:hypothetical protein [Anaerolineae bacterium]